MTVTIDFAIIGAVCGLILSIAAVIKLVAKPLKKIQEQYYAVSSGMVVILHFRLTRECMRIQKQGCMTLGQRQDLEDIYDAYHALGGNGSGHQMYMDTMRLSVCEEKACERKENENED